MARLSLARRALGRALIGAESTLRAARRAVLPPLREQRLDGVDAPKPVEGAREPKAGSQISQRFRNADTYNSHPGFDVTIEAVVSMYRLAERGTPWKQFDLFDDVVENDGHLRGLIENRNLSVAGKPWVIIPGDDKPGSKKAAEDLGKALANDLGFRETLEHQLFAPYNGIAVTETVWDVGAGDLLLPKRFVNLAARRFGAPDMNRADDIHLITSDVRSEWIRLSDHPGRFMVTRYRGRNPWAAGLLRTAVWWAIFKRWSIRDWQIFAEKFGLPLVVGYYSEGASPTSRAALQDAVAALGDDGFAILSDLTEIVLKDSARQGDATGVYPSIQKACEEQMSKLIAGGTLSQDSGGNGSYAQASVHEARGYVLALADAARVEESFTRNVGLPFVQWNSYGGAAPPRLKIQVVREVDPLVRAQILAILANDLGVEIPDDQVREEFHLRSVVGGKSLKGTKRIEAEKPDPKPAAPAGLSTLSTPEKLGALLSFWRELAPDERGRLARAARDILEAA